MTTLFGVFILFFPVYESIIPTDGYALITLVIGAAVLVPWAVFCLRYAGRDHLLTKRRIKIAGILIYLFVTVFILNFAEIIPESTVLTVLLGVGIVILLGGTFAIVGIVLLSTYRDDELAMEQSLALVLPFVVLWVNSQGIGVDPTTRTIINATGFAVATGSLWVAVTRYNGLTRRPGTSGVGFRSVVTEMNEAVLILNTDHNVVNANEAAKTLFPSNITGESFETVLGQSIATVRTSDTLEYTTTSGIQKFDARVSIINGGSGQRLGLAVTLIDVTDREMRRQRIEVLNRILRHNVRNDLDVVLAHTNSITDDDIRSNIRCTLQSTLRLCSKARDAEEVMSAVATAPEAFDLFTLAMAVAEEFRSGEPSGNITVEGDDVQIISHEQVVRQILHELVENAVKHSDNDAPIVHITVREQNDSTEIVVADNGPGIPDLEQGALSDGKETQLKHGTGIGLWFVNWAVTQLGGELEFDKNDAKGCMVTIRLYE
jgi:signal transduction histidine kinase